MTCLYRGWLWIVVWITQLNWVIIHSCEWFALEKESDDVFVEEEIFWKIFRNK